jgi:hypothetical protein
VRFAGGAESEAVDWGRGGFCFFYFRWRYFLFGLFGVKEREK